MLQQTQVSTVIPYYTPFISRFPTIAGLAEANEDDVLAHWSGLGYYARARNLHRAAQHVMALHGGRFPDDFEAIRSLPGIGRTTAAAIAVFAFGQRHAILDGNVKRVLSRYFGIAGDERELWQRAEALVPIRDIEAYTQALMDVGASVCTRKAHCKSCPLARTCVATKTGRVLEFPLPRRMAALPEKRVTWLVLFYRGRVLLEKRPPSGVWGGLWCFPETQQNDERGVQEHAAAWRCAGELAPFRHTFTHFRLTITPRVFEIEELRTHASESREQWLNQSSAINAALPAPARRLLLALAQDHDFFGAAFFSKARKSVGGS